MGQIIIVKDFELHERNDLVSEFLSTGVYGEFDELNSLLHIIRNDDAKVIVDIGANIGIHTVNYAVNNPNSIVYAIEPSIDNLRVLMRNIDRYNLDNVKVVFGALSDENGTATIYDNAGNSGDARIYQTSDYQPMGSHETPTYTLDKVLENADGLDYIKMDTQGCEFEIFTGGKDVIIKNRPVIFMEFWPWGLNQRGKRMDAFLEVIDACDYKIMYYHLREPVVEEVDKDFVISYYERMKHVDDYINLLLY